jgi:hypothetical protein
MRDINNLVIKISGIIALYIVALVATVNLGTLTNPIVSNKIALGQMSNDNISFMIMDAYVKLHPVAYVVIGIVTIVFIVAIIGEIKKYISKTKENKKK